MADPDKIIKLISDKLREEKYNVKNQNQVLLIDLPMFCSVSTHIVNNQINIKSKFGKIERSKAIVITSLIVILLIGLSTISVVGPFLLIGAIGAIVWDFIRWKKTQRVINIISQASPASLNT